MIEPAAALTPDDRRRRFRLTAPLATAGAGLVMAVAATSALGAQGAVSAGLGTAVVVLFFWTGTLPLKVVRRDADRAAFGLGVLLMNYALRLLLAVLVLAAAGQAGAVDERWTGLSVIACTLVWVAAQAALVLRVKPTL